MFLFPDVIGSGLRQQILFPSETKQYGQQSYQRFRAWLTPRILFDLEWAMFSQAEALAFEAHAAGMMGGATVFGWYHWVEEAFWMWAPCGTGTGALTAFTLPSKLTSSVEVFSGAGTAHTVDVVTFGTGPDGQDQVVLQTAPANGAPVWCNFTGRRLFSVSMEDEASITRLLNPDAFHGMNLQLATAKT